MLSHFSCVFNKLSISLDDYNRVVLDTVDREPDSDYINASYIDVSMELSYNCFNSKNFLKYLTRIENN